MKFAYADPPYPGLARRYYFEEEVDHGVLLETLVNDFDGWALSTSSESLQDVLSLCPPGCRVGIWIRPCRPIRRVTPANCFEPVVFRGGRRLPPEVPDVTDVLVWKGRQHSHPDALTGMKPAAFCEWIFRMLGAVEGDTLKDLFPGSGAVGRAWDLFQGIQPNEHLAPSRLAESMAHLANDVKRDG